MFRNRRIHGVAEVPNILELRGSYELRNSETRWSGGIPWNSQAPKQSSPIQVISGQGALTVQLGQDWGNKSNRGRARLEGGMGGGEYMKPHGHKPKTSLHESLQHLSRPLSTGGHTTLPPCGVPTGWQC
jgi:hypothetical protein